MFAQLSYSVSESAFSWVARITGFQVAGFSNGLLSLAVWHGGPGNVREPDRKEPAGCSEVHPDA